MWIVNDGNAFYKMVQSGNVYFSEYICDMVKCFDTYNPETHELVEKKEAKVKRLNEEKLELESKIKYIDELILDYSKHKSEYKVEIREIDEELEKIK